MTTGRGSYEQSENNVFKLPEASDCKQAPGFAGLRFIANFADVY